MRRGRLTNAFAYRPRTTHLAWLFAALVLLLTGQARAETGHEAWLRYPRVDDAALRDAYRAVASHVVIEGAATPVLESAATELQRGLSGMLGQQIPRAAEANAAGAIVLSIGDAPVARGIIDALSAEGRPLKEDGFVLRSVERPGGRGVVIVARNDSGALYGAFALLRKMQLRQPINDLDVRDEPAIPMRIVNHWDNLDGTIERGYAGKSVFDWATLPQLDDHYGDYARLLASLGIHGLCPNNESGFQGASTLILKPEYLKKAAALAEPFRAYGIKLYFAVGFNAPKVIGGLPTADPLDPAVRQWWTERADEIYTAIPDFGGFVVKADSEGQPGPYDNGRDHADGANMLAEALKPHGGLVLWRTFVYHLNGGDRARMGYDTFHPLDGKFADNVVLYAMHAPIDFLTREPVSPLWGNMPRTNMMAEFQIVQEYNGQNVDLCYLVPQWRDMLNFDTFGKGEGSTVTKVIDGSLFAASHSGIAGVPNVGRDATWLGHPLHMANFYGFGRLAWNPKLDAREIASEWTQLTFGSDPDVMKTVTSMLMGSFDIYESYTAPMGLGVLHDAPAHFDPAPQYRRFYHHADSDGVGFDRTQQTGSGFAGQYAPPLNERYESVETTPESLLLFFHHLPYTFRLHSGKTLIQQMYDLHFDGAAKAAQLREQWRGLKGKVDDARFDLVLKRLDEQVAHAAVWRDTVNLFFYQLSGVADEKKRIRSDYRLILKDAAP